MKIYFINWKADYEVRMIHYLRGHYPVFDIYVPDNYVWLDKKLKKLGLRNSWVGKFFIKRHLKNLQSHDVVVFNDSLLNKGINQYIIDAVDCHKVLLLRNSVCEDRIDKYCKIFDLIYDFENKVANNKKIKHLEQFFPIGFNEISNFECANITNKKPIFFFLGRDKGRFDIISTLADKLMEREFIVDFNVVKDKGVTLNSKYFIDKPLSYEENLRRSLSSDVLVDITQRNQTGWTLRILESLYFNKKVITNNINIINSSIYSPQRFFILDYDDWNNLENFINSSIEPIAVDVLYKFSPDFMIERISRDIMDI